ncbi:MFS general substrate transporter [Microthyrium microscopicum]|uniref:MFS general substrate transporter n=1 Tax=Microthyrium microscopicum TaxID=703497 RepID=A0A6A6UGT7_9PEZI|nr:MFS general substrate transporter [Microthyrium microscopicum]
MSESLLSKVKFLVIAGVGLFSDGFLNLAIGLVVQMLGYIYFKDEKNALGVIQGDEVKAGLSLGMIGGQLAFGILGDALGRHSVYGIELIITMFGVLMTILLPWKGLSHTGIVAWMTIFRVVTGFGIGADYPMSSSLSAEKTALGSRAVLVLTVFSCIGAGAMASSIVYLILLSAFKSSILHDINHLEWVWRLLLGIGIIPAALTLYARLTMKESKPYEQYVAKETSLTKKDQRGLKEQFIDFHNYFKEWRHAKVLFSVSAVWFLLVHSDIAYYGINLNQTIILAQIGYGKGKTPYETLHNTAVGNIIVQAAGYLPGFWIGIFLPDLIGRKNQQFWCSLIVCALYAIWAGITNHTSTGGLMTIFTISQLVINAGPNTTTFLLPVELFPTRVRATAHGIAAASGKCGALLTAFAFGTITEKIGLPGVLGLFSGIMFLCALLTLMIPETKGKTLDDIENEVLYGETPQVRYAGSETPSDKSVTVKPKLNQMEDVEV